jgi:hypothetical protein
MMNYREDLPHEVEETRHVVIEMPDGVRLSARLWLPKGAENRPVPAILEYIPYRKNDHTAVRDSMMHGYFAGYGYACVRVDLRGSGDSEGILRDEYLQSELDDGVRVLDWIAAQPWCDGSIGMIGISWGGFNGLQIAAMRPDPLKAVVTVCSTDDRYADDVHYMGGCLLGDNISWASQMFAYNSMPPDPEQVGDKWREMWLERLEANEPWLITWLQHQQRDDYWRHGSICEDWSDVQCPVMAVSGWADGYSNAVFRLLSNLETPRLGLVGPWSHKYPHIGEPGPAIGFLQECIRWWDKWLKGEESGIMEEPMLRAWMQDSMPPTTSYRQRPGRWVGEDEWPSANVEERAWRLMPGYRLLPQEDLREADAHNNPDDLPYISVESPLSTGLFAGKWCSYAATPDLPHDQRQEDGGALVFNSPRLTESIEILGAPVLEFEFEADRPVAMVAVRLSDILPDDKATRVSYGVRNLAHSDDHAEVQPIGAGRHRVRVKLNHIAQHFPAGHRIRVAISTSYWPLAWPSPEPVKLKVFTDACRLLLPVRPPRGIDEDVHFAAAEAASPVPTEQKGVEDHNWHVIYDLARDQYLLHVVDDDGIQHIADADIDYIDRTEEWYASIADEFESISAEVRAKRGLRRGDWRPHTTTRTKLTCTAEHFIVTAELDAWEDDQRVFSRNWQRRIPRNGI